MEAEVEMREEAQLLSAVAQLAKEEADANAEAAAEAQIYAEEQKEAAFAEVRRGVAPSRPPRQRVL